MRNNLILRRKELLEGVNSGIPLHKVVKSLMVKYGKTRQTLYADWKNRKTWIDQILEIDQPQEYFKKIVGRHEDLYKKCVEQWLSASSETTKTNCLRLLRELNMD